MNKMYQPGLVHVKSVVAYLKKVGKYLNLAQIGGAYR